MMDRIVPFGSGPKQRAFVKLEESGDLSLVPLYIRLAVMPMPKRTSTVPVKSAECSSLMGYWPNRIFRNCMLPHSESMMIKSGPFYRNHRNGIHSVNGNDIYELSTIIPLHGECRSPKIQIHRFYPLRPKQVQSLSMESDLRRLLHRRWPLPL